jgi:predicted enzyme related to lactoylglutathione lyase
MARKPTGDRKKAGAKPATRPSRPRHRFTRGFYGWITHTDLASLDPAATKAWCAEVLGWTFKPTFRGPGGEVHLFTYSAQGGGGIRATNPHESPGSLPFVHVPDALAAFAKALKEGAEEMMPPTRVMKGVTVAIVRAPGGVPIGFSGP